MSRYLKRSKTSISRFFNRIPNLAVDQESDSSFNKDIPPDTGNADELRQWYDQLLAKVRDGPREESYGGKLEDVQQLQKAVDEIVRDGKDKMADSQSTEEIVFRFMAGIYKIKSLL